MFYKKISLCLLLLTAIASCNCMEETRRQAVSNETRVEERKIEVKQGNSVYFDFNSSKLTPSAKQFIDNVLLPDLKNNPNAIAKIDGYCDERGSFAYNKKLGKKRAEAVKSRFVEKGINPNRITTYSYGELNPEDPSHNESAWAKNRRVVTNIDGQETKENY